MIERLNANLPQNEALLMAELGECESKPARKRVFVSSSSPNPNGDIHLGHLAGPFLCADIYGRYRRLCGDEVYYQSGTDDYQSWTVAMAEKLGTTPRELADRYGAAIAESCALARIEVAQFQRPSASAYSTEIAQDMILRLSERGLLVTKEVAAPYCEACHTSLYDVFAKGQCPRCDAPACGSGCEACGSPLDGVDLVSPHCGRCGQAAVPRAIRKLYLPLEPHRERLERYYDTLITNTWQRAFWRRLLERGLPDLPASQPTTWGVPIPLPGFDGQCVSPWIQMTADHLASSRELAEEIGATDGWASFWRSDDAEVAQFCGADNSWVFGVLYAAVLTAYDPEIRPAAALLPTHFYKLEGQIFSTSKRHAIWVRELVEKSSADVARFHCASTCPEAEETTFRLTEFVETVHRELIDRWETWLTALWAKVVAESGGLVPAATAWTGEHVQFHDRLRRLSAQVRSAYEGTSFSPQLATRFAGELVHAARLFGRAEEHRRIAAAGADEKSAGLALELAAARTLAFAVAPVMPDFADHLWRALGYEGSLWNETWDETAALVPAGQRLGSFGDTYFPRVHHLLAT